ncbi:MAG TPA: hypothetical protein VNG69_01245 [Casimicrobiaceae bacterium]|nr:hypothetical protein [Casimicrobiaceae bacterium]
MRLVLLAPSLLAQPPDALAAIGELARLSFSSRKTATNLDAALLDALGIDAPVAPLAALGAGVDVGARFVMRADPISMTVMRDDVRIDARVDDLDPSEAASLQRLLNDHFALDGLEFIAARRNEWFVASPRRFDVRTTALDASIGCALRDRLPAGPDGAHWRRWFTETQMLLFEHALGNRVTRPVNGAWFSEGGVLPARLLHTDLDIHATNERAGNLARGIAKLDGKSSLLPTSLPSPAQSSRDMIAIVESIANADRLARFIRAWLAPAIQLLDAKRVTELMVIADGHGSAACWMVGRRGWISRLRSRSSPFAVPNR